MTRSNDGPALPSGMRTPLSRDRIVEAALLLARDRGMAGVSMRQLGKQLGVQPMSLYYHVPSRAVLMVLMAARSVAALPAPDQAHPWQRRLIDLLVQTYVAGVENPAVFPVLASESLRAEVIPPLEPKHGAASIGLIEQVLDILAEAGVPDRGRLLACRGLIGLVVGFMVGQVDGLAPVLAEESESSVRGPNRPGTTTPRRPAALTAMHDRDPAVGLRFSLEVFVRGLPGEDAERVGEVDRVAP